jgi:hypothetical protein
MADLAIQTPKHLKNADRRVNDRGKFSLTAVPRLIAENPCSIEETPCCGVFFSLLAKPRVFAVSPGNWGEIDRLAGQRTEKSANTPCFLPASRERQG